MSTSSSSVVASGQSESAPGSGECKTLKRDSIQNRCPFALDDGTDESDAANADPKSFSPTGELNGAVLLDPSALTLALDNLTGSDCSALARMAIPAIEENENLDVLAHIHQEALKFSFGSTNHSPIANDSRREDEKSYDSYFGIERVEGDASVFVHAVIAAFGNAYQCDGISNFEGLSWLRAGERELLRLAIQDQILYSELIHE